MKAMQIWTISALDIDPKGESQSTISNSLLRT